MALFHMWGLIKTMIVLRLTGLILTDFGLFLTINTE